MADEKQTTATAEAEADQIAYRSLSVLNRIYTIASMARNELQGRLVDEGHRKAFMALSLIVREIQNGQ